MESRTFVFQLPGSRGVECRVTELQARAGKTRHGKFRRLYSKELSRLKKELKRQAPPRRRELKRKVGTLKRKRHLRDVQCLDAQLASKPCVRPGLHAKEILVGDLRRQVLVYVPSSYVCGKEHPLVLNFHGGGADAEMQREAAQMEDDADRAGAIIAYPQGNRTPGLPGTRLGRTWNAGRCCGYAQESNLDDVVFIRALLDGLSGTLWIDMRRVYATGLSNGALFAYRLACEMSEIISAVAPVAAHDAYERRVDGSYANEPASGDEEYYDLCAPTHPVSVMHFHGTADPTAFYQYVEERACGLLEPWTCSSVPKYVQSWAARNGCLKAKEALPIIGDLWSSAVELQERSGGSACIRYTNCSSDGEVRLCTLEGGGHTWPGGPDIFPPAFGPLSLDLDASRMMLEFFLTAAREHGDQ